MRHAELKNSVRADPLVRAVLSRFPGAEIVDVRQAAGTPVADDLPEVFGDPDVPDDEP
jgi:DNA polymerase-3 subunit gamma/tau